MDKTNDELKISIVVATYNRADVLKILLRYLVQQDIDPYEFEVILVNDGSSDHTEQVVQHMIPLVPFNLSYLSHENHGIGFTQNRGIKSARAGLILLIADDIFLAPNALREHIDLHRKKPEPEIVVLGNVVQSPELNHSVFLRKWDPFRFNELEGLEELRPYRFGACNISFKKDFMIQYGMFLEHLGRGGPAAMEDLEVGYRLEKHGMRLLFAPNALGYHHHVTTLDSAVRRWYERGLNYGEFRKHATHPELTVYFHILTLKTLHEYFRVLQGPNSFRGREKSFIWHIIRELGRRITLNQFTSTVFWRPILDMAEKKPWIASFMTAKVYRAYLYHKFLSGVSDARKIYSV